MNKISVIMPAYNVEKYIGEAIDSIINQSIGFDNIELIIIDDASTDKTPIIISEYSSKFKQITSIRNVQRIRYPGNLKNLGIKIASGEYIMFLDSDDIMVNHACEILYEVMKKYKSDFVLGKHIVKYDETGKEEIHEHFRNEKFKTPVFNTNLLKLYKGEEKAFSAKDFIQLTGVSGNRMFNLEFLKNKKIFFTENQITGEDYFLNHQCFLKADKFSYFPVNVYFYRQRKDPNNLSITQIFSTEIIEGIYQQRINTLDIYKDTIYPYDKWTNAYYIKVFFYKIRERKNNEDAELIRIFADLKPRLHAFDIEDNEISLYAKKLFRYISKGEFQAAIDYIRK